MRKERKEKGRTERKKRDKKQNGRFSLNGVNYM